MGTAAIISKGFESWINTKLNDKVSVLIDYKDEQKLSMKSYHKASAKLVLLGIHDSKSYEKTLISVENVYNHGTTTEAEAKEQLLSRLVGEMFSLYGDIDRIN